MPALAYAPYRSSASPLGVGDVGVGATICEKRNTLKARQARQGGHLSPEDAAELKRIRDKIKRTGWSCGGPFEDIVGTVVDVVTAPVKAVAAATSSIPVLGDVTRIVSNASSAPLNLANSIASGARIDRAVMGHLKAELKNVKEAAPYAQMVISIVPGVGPGVSAAISAGVALSEGRSIDEIAKAAIRGAIPGGPLAVAAFDTALKVAAGENVAKSVLEGARAQLPAAAQKAYDIGLAVMTGEKIQNALASGLASLAPDQVRSLVAAGQKALGTTPAFANAIKSVASGAPKEGFELAAGLLSQTGLSQKAVAAVRKQLPLDKLSGFDAALKVQEGNIAWLKDVTAAPVRKPLVLQAAPTVRKPLVLQAAPTVRKSLVLQAAPKPAASAPTKVAVTAPAAAGAPAAGAPPAVSKTAQALAYAPYPSDGALSAPPGGGHGHGGHRGPHGGGRGRGRPSFAGRHGRSDWGWQAPWWGAPWSPEVVTRVETCRTWGDPIAPLPPAMQTAAQMALGASKGRPTTVRGPDNVLYLFAFENGTMTARPCAAVATGA